MRVMVTPSQPGSYPLKSMHEAATQTLAGLEDDLTEDFFHDSFDTGDDEDAEEEYRPHKGVQERTLDDGQPGLYQPSAP